MENKQTNAFALGLENIVCTTRDNNRNNKVFFLPLSLYRRMTDINLISFFHVFR